MRVGAQCSLLTRVRYGPQTAHQPPMPDLALPGSGTRSNKCVAQIALYLWNRTHGRCLKRLLRNVIEVIECESGFGAAARANGDYEQKAVA